MAKLITVFGATGQQGTGIIKALLEKGTFKVRGITRKPDGKEANALKEKGVEVVQANLDDPASLDAAVKDSYGVFVVTNFWESVDQKKEEDQGKAAADACKKAGVKHLVYSGLENVEKVLGKNCPHFDGKAEVERHMDEIGIPNTSVWYPFYYENFLKVFRFEKAKDGDGYELTTCHKGMRGIHMANLVDCGVAVAAIFSQPEEYIGKKVGLSTDSYTMKDSVEIIAKATGKKITVNIVEYEEFSKFPFPGANAMAVMFEYFDKVGLDRDMEVTKSLVPNPQSFQDWVAENKDSFTFAV